jgi:transcriptional regulator with XRE-family HTH domain
VAFSKGGSRWLYAIAYTVGMASNLAPDPLAGDLLRLARAKARLTQSALAERAGVAQSLISAYENGHRQPTLPVLKRLLVAAGFELRTRLEEPDRQSRAVEQWETTRPAEERRRWAKEQRAVAAGRR